MSIEILSSREYGEPKLTKPRELKGIPAIGHAPFGAKCNCPVYLTATHIYIKHRDWFSPAIDPQTALAHGIIGKWQRKFVYNDNYGSVVLRSEAWLRMPRDLPARWQHLLLPQYGLCYELETALRLPPDTITPGTWPRFFESLLQLLQKAEKP